MSANPWDPMLGRTLLELTAVFEARRSGRPPSLVRSRLLEHVSDLEAAGIIGPKLKASLGCRWADGRCDFERLLGDAYEQARPVLGASILEVLDLYESRLAA